MSSLQIISARSKIDDLTLLCETVEQNHISTAEHSGPSLMDQFFRGFYKPCVGDYLLVYHDSVLVGGSGYYRYDKEHVIGMTKFYIMPGQSANVVATELVKAQTERSRGLGNKMLVVFSGYSRRAYDICVRKFERHSVAWHGFIPVGKIKINFVENYCCERKL